MNFNEEKAVSRFRELIKQKTISDKNGNFDKEVFGNYLPLLKKLYPKAFEKAETRLINDYGILIKWKGKNSSLKPVVLMSHYDVVSDEGQEWEHPAFEAEIHDGVIWGRGTIDTKCLMAATLEGMEKLLSEGHEFSRDIYYASSNSEEVAGDTMPKIVEWFEENNIKPWFVLDEGGAIMENIPMGIKTPFAMVAVSEKGWATLELTANAKTASHGAKASKTADKISAPEKIINALSKIKKNPTKCTVTPALEGMLQSFSPYVPEPAKSVLNNVHLISPALKKLLQLNDDTAAMIRSTMIITAFNAFDESGAVPKTATATLKIRIAPQDNFEDIISHIKKTVGEDIEVTVKNLSLPPEISDHNTQSFSYIKSTVQKVYPNTGVAPFILNAGTDSRHFRRICNEVYRFGAFHLDDARFSTVHSANERVPISEYMKTCEFYYEFLKNLK